ncbi:hypothetical protein L6Q96_10650 [Candidatus Binatia bacterium]|nr:hypothetical protein [Candidatus Binatia bacterium]
MPTPLDARRESGRAFFEALGAGLADDEVVSDRRCVRLLIDKAQAEHAGRTRKRFDAGAVFRQRILYDRIDTAVAAWCRRREIRTEPFNVFRYEGPERGPTQHETAIGPSLPFVERTFDRLAAAVPEIVDSRRAVIKAPTRAIAPGFRLQHPLPFGAAGEIVYDGDRSELDRAVYRVAMYVATTGDPSRSWRYDCGLLIFYGAEAPRQLLGDSLWEVWPDVQARLWDAGRVWTILL